MSRVEVQGRSRLDAGDAVLARGRRDLVQCGRGSGGDTGCAESTKRGAAAAVAELPAAPVLPRSVSVCGLGCVRRRGEPRPASRGPHPLFIALCDGGPPTMDWLGAPDQGAVTSPLRPLGRNGEEIELTTMFRRHALCLHYVGFHQTSLPCQDLLSLVSSLHPAKHCLLSVLCE
jgi:hypothetical protein